MAKELYEVVKHIDVVSSAALRCEGLVGLLAVAAGFGSKPKAGWARSEGIDVSVLLKPVMTTFCQIDLRCALPEWLPARKSSLEHLAATAAAFAGDDESKRRFYKEQYDRFDGVARPFYIAYGHALGGTVTAETVSSANQAIDLLFLEPNSLRDLRGREFTEVRDKMATTLANARTLILAPEGISNLS
ncbi:hypothetical protein IPL85_05685 [Candidatus Saccharibacteria bacterium]|nr:MAG: hypothetical protein IPL85_05685 [Candidatus Saccharibacteria bacterium]